MNILHISRTMGQGGAEKIVYQIASKSNTEENHIVVASCGGVYVKMLERQNVQHYEIYDLECKNSFVILQNLRSLFRIIKEEGIEIVHTHHRMAALYARLLKLCFPNLKLIYTAHNIFSNRKLLTRLALSGSQIVAVGDGVRDNLTEYFGIDPDRIQIIYNAVQPETIKKENYHPFLQSLKSQNVPLVGAIGRLSEQKGMDVFIEAFHLVKKKLPGVKGIMIGDGELRDQLQEQIYSLGLDEDVYLLGYQEHVSTLIHQLDLVVMPSRWEGFPLTPIEVFSANKTLVASNISGIRDIVKHMENGILVPKEDVDGFAEAIVQLLREPEFRKQMEAAGKRYYEKHFHYQSFMNQYNEAYQKML